MLLRIVLYPMLVETKHYKIPVNGSTNRAFTAEARIANYYGLFFLSIGSVMPFAALWFASLDISSSMSGTIFAAPSFIIVLFTILMGGWADRLSDWRTAIIVCNWVVLALFSWFLIRDGYWDILIIWTLAGFFTHASNPIMDAAALSLTKRRGSDFGRIRAVGSIGFIVAISWACSGLYLCSCWEW